MLSTNSARLRALRNPVLTSPIGAIEPEVHLAVFYMDNGPHNRGEELMRQMNAKVFTNNSTAALNTCFAQKDSNGKAVVTRVDATPDIFPTSGLHLGRLTFTLVPIPDDEQSWTNPDAVPIKCFADNAMIEGFPVNETPASAFQQQHLEKLGKKLLGPSDFCGVMYLGTEEEQEEGQAAVCAYERHVHDYLHYHCSRAGTLFLPTLMDTTITDDDDDDSDGDVHCDVNDLIQFCGEITRRRQHLRGTGGLHRATTERMKIHLQDAFAAKRLLLRTANGSYVYPANLSVAAKDAQNAIINYFEEYFLDGQWVLEFKNAKALREYLRKEVVDHIGAVEAVVSMAKWYWDAGITF